MQYARLQHCVVKNKSAQAIKYVGFGRLTSRRPLPNEVQVLPARQVLRACTNTELTGKILERSVRFNGDDGVNGGLTETRLAVLSVLLREPDTGYELPR